MRKSIWKRPLKNWVKELACYMLFFAYMIIIMTIIICRFLTL